MKHILANQNGFPITFTKLIRLAFTKRLRCFGLPRGVCSSSFKLLSPAHHFSACDEFIVDSCSPDPSQTINSVPLPNTGLQTFQCQTLCNGQTRKHCAYWSISCHQNPVETCTCTFYESSYLHSCQKVGGDKDVAAEVILLRGVISKLKTGCKSRPFGKFIWFWQASLNTA